MSNDGNRLKLSSVILKMDPTLELCTLRDSFTDPSADFKYPAPFSFEDAVPDFVPEIETVTQTPKLSLPPIYIDPVAYAKLQQDKHRFDGIPETRFIPARDAANPFEGIKNSIFMNRAAVKLANLDAIYNLTYHTNGSLFYQTVNDLTFCDLASAPGGFGQYLLWRLPTALGYAISLKSGFKWPKNLETLLDFTRYHILWGQQGEGDLYVEADWFANKVRESIPEGVTLVTADGGVEAAGQEDQQETLSSRLILAEILTALLCLRPGGNLVLKTFDTVTEISAQLIFVIASCFQYVHIIRPASSRQANAEQYIVAQNRRENIGSYIELLQEAYAQYGNNQIVTKLVTSLPSSFQTWLYYSNQFSLQDQREGVDRILALLAGQKVEIPKYKLKKALAVWNLPGEARNV